MSRACSSSPQRTEAYLRSLAVTLHDLSYDPLLSSNLQVNNQLSRSVKILSTVSSFISRLRTLILEFENSCFNDKESIVLNMQALGRVIESLGDMFSTLGNSKAAKDIRKGTLITDKIVVSFTWYQVMLEQTT